MFVFFNGSSNKNKLKTNELRKKLSFCGKPAKVFRSPVFQQLFSSIWCGQSVLRTRNTRGDKTATTAFRKEIIFLQNVGTIAIVDWTTRPNNTSRFS